MVDFDTLCTRECVCRVVCVSCEFYRQPMASAPPEDPTPEWAIREGEEELEDDEEGEPEVEEVIEDDDAEEDAEPVPSESDRLCTYMSNALFRRFDAHVDDLVSARKRRQEALAFRSAVEDGGGAMEDEVGSSGTQTQDELDGLGVKLPTDVWQGDCNMRTLDKLLARVDARGFERCVRFNPTVAFPPGAHVCLVLRRSAQQLEFHQAFKKAAARVIYRGSWETDRPMIMEKYGWERCNSEVLIRRVHALCHTRAHTHTQTHTDDCSLVRAQHPSSFWKDVFVHIALLNQNPKTLPHHAMSTAGLPSFAHASRSLWASRLSSSVSNPS